VCWTATHRSEWCTLKGPPILFCKHFDNPHHMCCNLFRCIGLMVGNLKWDDTCPELDRMVARKEEWRVHCTGNFEESQ
jgi:hypothetical protein